MVPKIKDGKFCWTRGWEVSEYMQVNRVGENTEKVKDLDIESADMEPLSLHDNIFYHEKWQVEGQCMNERK
jgi:hypothetical protein